jgi:hypothetical protein
VKVEDAGEHVASLIPGGYSGAFPISECEGGQRACHSQGSEEGHDYPEYLCITLRGIVESRGIDQNDAAAVEVKGLSNLYGICARS